MRIDLPIGYPLLRVARFASGVKRFVADDVPRGRAFLPVTGGAGNLRVPACQGERTLRLMIENQPRPTRRGVARAATGRTGGDELTAVHILVTCLAFAGGPRGAGIHNPGPVTMAAVAGNGGVLIQQREAGG
jgi:hypothetical protein